MEQRETWLDDLFREFQSSLDRAAPEDKTRLAARFYGWVEQQADLLGVLPANRPAGANPFPKNLRALVESEIHLRQVADNIEQVFWLRDLRSGDILYVNPAFEAVWGQPCEALYANPLLLIESVHPEDRVQVMAARPHNNNKPFNQAYRISRPDGSLRWIYAHTFLIWDPGGEPSLLFCIAQDISGQKQIEMALRKTLDRTREQFDLSRKMSLARKPEMALKTLMSAHELRSAQGAVILFFDNPEEGPARGVELIASWFSRQNSSPWSSDAGLYEEPSFWKLFQPNQIVIITDIQSDPRLSSQTRDFLLEGKVQTLALFPLVASGNWLGCLSVFYNQEHHFDHIELRHLKVLVDQAAITLFNLQLLEVEEASRHEAEKANEIKTEFLAMISHELRTPLTSIVGFTTTLLAEDVTWEPDEQRDFIQTIHREANRLQELIDHLLDLSRLEAGMLPISMEPHSIHEIMEDALPQFQILTSEHTLSIHLPAGLPAICVDAKRIAQVLVNLVRNATTYAPAGTEIVISSSVRGGFLQVNVSDQGPGIPQSDHKRVFKAFQRGMNEENGSGGGAGLGLAICKGLVEAHGGRIWIKKKTTPGATISFTLPLALGEKEK